MTSQGVFADEINPFKIYRTEILFRGKLVGGIPGDPAAIRANLIGKMGLQGEELKRTFFQTLRERHASALTADLSDDEILAAVDDLADSKAVGFKSDPEKGLYVEGRQVKAMLKECVNICYVGKEKWGPTNKGPKAYLAERVFVEPDRIYLDRVVADGMLTVIGTVSDRNGPRSIVSEYEYVESPTITFDVMVLDDCLDRSKWAKIWTHAQQNGMGAVRSQGHGKFYVTGWESVKL